MIKGSGARKALSSGLLFIGIVSSSFLLSVPASAAAQGPTGDGGGNFDTGNIQDLIDGFAWYALAFAITGIFVSAALWALGSKGQNPGQELTGKRGIMVCLTAAFIVGGLNPFMNVLQGYANDVEGSGGGGGGAAITNQAPTESGGQQ